MIIVTCADQLKITDVQNSFTSGCGSKYYYLVLFNSMQKACKHIITHEDRQRDLLTD